MFGLAAAPEIAMAVPSVIPEGYFGSGFVPAAYSELGLNATQPLPEWSGLTVKGSAFRSCQESRFEETMLSAMFTMWNGRHPSACGLLAGHSSCMVMLSLVSKPVKVSYRRSCREAPRNARVR